MILLYKISCSKLFRVVIPRQWRTKHFENATELQSAILSIASVIASNKFGNQNQLCHDDEIDDFLILEIASQARNKLENWDAFIFASRGIRALKIGV